MLKQFSLLPLKALLGNGLPCSFFSLLLLIFFSCRLNTYRPSANSQRIIVWIKKACQGFHCSLVMCEVRVCPVALLSNLKASKEQLDHLCFKLSFPLLSASTISHLF